MGIQFLRSLIANKYQSQADAAVFCGNLWEETERLYKMSDYEILELVKKLEIRESNDALRRGVRLTQL